MTAPIMKILYYIQYCVLLMCNIMTICVCSIEKVVLYGINDNNSKNEEK